MLVMALLVAGAGPLMAQRGGGTPSFPHRRHERLFPVCESCHAGILTGDAATSMPSETACRGCHNGTDEREVAWRRPVRAAGLLRFSHPAHAAEVDTAGRSCATCHARPGATRRMDVGAARPELCQGCHTHRASSHFADDNRCAACHVALTTATGLTTAQIAALPRPASHEARDFPMAHRPSTDLAAASCAVCHARESCARCHVNASTQPLIASLASDPRVASLVVDRGASYPVPADHAGDAFGQTHGEAARTNTERCIVCHARPSCTTCHIGSAGRDVIGRIPEAPPGGPAGVRLELRPAAVRARPPLALRTQGSDTVPVTPPSEVSVHADGFRLAHGTQAAAGRLSCEGCHEQQFCSDCHAGENRRRFHPSNFAQRHAADAYGRETECASCHNAELFCRSCHQQSGLASKGRLDAAFHNAQPQWLLQHGRAARQGLQGCTTCHVQRDCLTCHSTLGWGVSPHGPGFPADRLASRNATQCLLCHLRVPGRP
jgi:predicted CXXCH cytochrome family protein